MTPPLPQWLTGFHLPGYVNVYEVLPDETRLYGTESLYGDWNARVLLLAKDFACSDILHQRIAAGDQRPYRHEPTLRTNRALQQLAGPLCTADDAKHCGLLYGSALASLCRDDGNMSGALPNRAAAIEFGSRVLEFTLENMPRAEVIVCLGAEAWLCASSTLGFCEKWITVRDATQFVSYGGLKIVAAYHPAARVTKEKARSPWKLVGSLNGE